VEHYNPNGGETIPSFRNLAEIKTKSVLEAALDYHGRGLIVTPLHGKRPILGRWQKRILDESELPYYFVDGRNVGLVLGGPAGVVDVDLDNPVAVTAADLLLPDTVKSGRKGSLHLHWWYLCHPAPAPRKYALPKSMAERLVVEPGEDVLVELRSTGQQTMVPPGIHPLDDDRCLWYPGEIREIDGAELAGLVLDVAIATLLALSRPLGSREWFAIHAAGYLSPHLGPERAERIVAAASAAFDEEEHTRRMQAVRSALRKPVDDDPTFDAVMAAELERLAPGVAERIARWCARDRRDHGGVQ
jgi:putative DNA primase/helicase